MTKKRIEKNKITKSFLIADNKEKTSFSFYAAAEEKNKDVLSNAEDSLFLRSKKKEKFSSAGNEHISYLPSKIDNLEKKGFLFKKFTNKQDLLCFLQKENNSYSRFILEKISSVEKRVFSFAENKYHSHHIQPKHAGGSNASWNYVYLSVEDHAKAHELLYKNYKNHFDLCAALMIQNKTKEALIALRKENQEKMKQNNVGFYNSELQRELAKRPRKKRCSYTKNFFVKKALEKGFLLESIETKSILEVKPGEFLSIREVLNKWMDHPEMFEIK